MSARQTGTIAADDPGAKAEAPVGILSGGGTLPIDIAGALAAKGRQVHFVAFKGHADDAVRAWPSTWVSLGQVGSMLGAFRAAGCREVVIAGSIQRPDLLTLRFDLGLLRHIGTVLQLTRGGDDSVLRRIVGFFESQGFIVRGVGDLVPELLAQQGAWGMHPVNATHAAAIARGRQVLDALGPFDLGQGVVTTADRVVAVEGARGTDAMLTELGEGGSGEGLGRGGVLVKLPKPGQEMRVDLPAIGRVTVERARAAGLAGIAVGAGAAIVLERKTMMAAADDAGLFVTGIEWAAVEKSRVVEVPGPTRVTATAPVPVILGRVAPTPSDRRDIAVARRLLPILKREEAGQAAVVAGEHVLAVSGALAIEPLIRPLGARRHWGLRAFRGRIGTLAVDLSPAPRQDAPPVRLDLDFFRAVQDARLAGVACFGAAIPESVKADVIAWANEAKVFLMSEIS